jgi:hypothetical protein
MWSHRPTILKEMLLYHPQQLVRVATDQMSVTRKHFFENCNANRVKVKVSLPEKISLISLSAKVSRFITSPEVTDCLLNFGKNVI